MPRIDMRLTESDMREEFPDRVPDSETPVFPGGLRIHLNDVALKKLLLKELPDVGMELNLDALVKVVEVSEDEENGGKTRKSMVLQITAMGLFADSKSDTDKFYGGTGEMGKPTESVNPTQQT